MLLKMFGGADEEMPEVYHRVMRTVLDIMQHDIPTDNESVVAFSDDEYRSNSYRVLLLKRGNDLAFLPKHESKIVNRNETGRYDDYLYFGKAAYFGLVDHVIRATEAMVTDRSVFLSLNFEDVGTKVRPKAGFALLFARFQLVFLNDVV